MKIIWFTWKDRSHPEAGGAEVVNEELAVRLAADGHGVIFLVGGFEGGAREETRQGFKIIRLGNRFSVYFQAYKYYKKNLVGWADLVIDEVNTIPFFCKFFVKEKNIILSYQLCREVWFYQMIFPLNLLGYLIEPIYLWLLRKQQVLTESESTRIDFQKYGFKKDNISIFPIGLETEPIKLEEFNNQKKEENPTILCLGSIRDMKRSIHVLKAFEILKQEIKTAKLFMVGSGGTKYAEKFFKKVANSKYKNDITYFGKVDNRKKLEIIQRSHLICATSVKEGWGLIITEANSQGTPAIVYNVDGLRDAVKNNLTGLVTEKNNPQELSKKITQLLQDKVLYEKYRLNAWQDSFNYNYDNSYKIFINYLENFCEK
jgi:glycosyltransferase involved in cell wall biosynthesis